MAPLACLAHLVFGHRQACCIRSACTWCCDLAVCAQGHQVQKLHVVAFRRSHRIGRCCRHRKRQNNNCNFSDHCSPPKQHAKAPTHSGTHSHWLASYNWSPGASRRASAYAIKPFDLLTVPPGLLGTLSLATLRKAVRQQPIAQPEPSLTPLTVW
jgi:hypothetical protein